MIGGYVMYIYVFYGYLFFYFMIIKIGGFNDDKLILLMSR